MSGIEDFKELLLGGIDQEKLIHQLKSQQIYFNDYARRLFQHPAFSVSREIEKVTVVKVGFAELGLATPCPFHVIVERASNLGLRLCPLSLAAFLRLAYLDQPAGPYLTVASLKPKGDDDGPNGFYLRNFEGKLWLRGYRATDDYDWPIEHEFIFARSFEKPAKANAPVLKNLP